MEESWISVQGDGGVRLAVRTLPGPRPDAPSLLLHHGLASSQHIWDLMLPRLSRRLRVVTFDARGHGESAKPSSGYGFAHVVADLIAVADAAHLRRPVVVGHSWGAMVAIEAVAEHPRRFAGAVLVDGGVVPFGRHMDWATTKERLAPPHLAGMPVEEFRGLIRTLFADAVDVTPDVESIVLSVMRVDRAGLIRPRLSRANHLRILRAIWEQDPIALYERLRVPVAAILARRVDGGPEDRERLEARRRAIREIRRTAGDANVRFVWIDGIHDVPLQHPQELARRIERFAATIASS